MTQRELANTRVREIADVGTFVWYDDPDSANAAVYVGEGPVFFLNGARPDEEVARALYLLYLHHHDRHPGEVAVVAEGLDWCATGMEAAWQTG